MLVVIEGCVMNTTTGAVCVFPPRACPDCGAMRCFFYAKAHGGFTCVECRQHQHEEVQS